MHLSLGVIAFDGTSGFWMIHSSPKFPPPKSGMYTWSATDFGQTVLCISLPIQEKQKVGELSDVVISDDFSNFRK